MEENRRCWRKGHRDRRSFSWGDGRRLPLLPKNVERLVSYNLFARLDGIRLRWSSLENRNSLGDLRELRGRILFRLAAQWLVRVDRHGIYLYYQDAQKVAQSSDLRFWCNMECQGNVSNFLSNRPSVYPFLLDPPTFYPPYLGSAYKIDWVIIYKR